MTAILFDARRPVKTNRLFGLGVARPDREKRTPYTASDAQWWAENSPANQDGPCDAELARLVAESAALEAHEWGLCFA